jgi:integrase/recombinase XerD
MTPLRVKMIDEMKLRRFSPKTQEAYVSAVAGLAKFYNQPPDLINQERILKYLLYLMEDRKLAWNTCNVVVSGIRFFYTNVLGIDSKSLIIPPRKKKKRLPEILSGEELERLFNKAGTPKNRALFMTTYSAGLRVSEVVRLNIKDIDSGRMTIRIQQSKGNRDRYSILSPRLLEELRLYWKMYHPKQWLFPSSRDQVRPMSIDSAQKAYYAAKKKAVITKGGGIHTLRHCFATHLLEAGVDPRTIQVLMGHRSIGTTVTYMQVTHKRLTSIKSPLDLLDIHKSAP